MTNLSLLIDDLKVGNYKMFLKSCFADGHCTGYEPIGLIEQKMPSPEKTSICPPNNDLLKSQIERIKTYAPEDLVKLKNTLEKVLNSAPPDELLYDFLKHTPPPI